MQGSEAMCIRCAEPLMQRLVRHVMLTLLLPKHAQQHSAQASAWQRQQSAAR